MLVTDVITESLRISWSPAPLSTANDSSKMTYVNLLYVYRKFIEHMVMLLVLHSYPTRPCQSTDSLLIH